MAGKDPARRQAAPGQHVERRIAVIDIEAAARRGCRAGDRHRLGRAALGAFAHVEHDLPCQRDRHDEGDGPPPPPAAEHRCGDEHGGQDDGHGIMRAAKPTIEQHRRDRHRQPDEQHGETVPRFGRYAPPGPPERDHQCQRRQDADARREPFQLIGQRPRRLSPDRQDIAEQPGGPLPHRGIDAPGRQRREQRQRDPYQRHAGQPCHRHPRTPSPPEQDTAERHPLGQHRIFDLRRQADGRHRHRALDEQPPPPLNRAQHRCTGNQHQRIVEDRRLAPFPLHQVQPEDIEDRRDEPAHGAGEAPRHLLHAISGGDDEAGRDQLIGQEPVAPPCGPQSPRSRIEQEQPDRLAIEDIDIGQRAVEHPVADQQIELLVEPDHRIAETLRARGERDERQEQQRAPLPAPAAPSRPPALALPVFHAASG
ncbi:hypothetical protein L479_00991 [Exiguobacterium sp. S17]|nr:hypothetical protein L479_00991 [Exiguobacterium sp. S17]